MLALTRIEIIQMNPDTMQHKRTQGRDHLLEARERRDTIEDLAIGTMGS